MRFLSRGSFEVVKGGKTKVYAEWAGTLLKEQRSWLQWSGRGKTHPSFRGDRKQDIFHDQRGDMESVAL